MNIKDEAVVGGVSVRALEWEPVHGEGVETYQATCATGIYRVFEDEDSAAGAVFAEFAIDVSRFCMTDALSIGRFHNFDVAKYAAQADYEHRILSALASHKPAPDTLEPADDTLGANLGSTLEPAKDGPEVVERLRKWCSETINQWSDEYEPRENWERQVSGAMREWDKATTEIISDYEALRAENERLRIERITAERDAADYMKRLNKAAGKLSIAENVIAELVKALEPFASVAGEWDGQPAALSIFLEWNDEPEAVPNILVEDFRRARAALKGQSNEA